MGRRLVLVAAASALAAAAVFACGSDDLLSALDLDAGYTFLDSSVPKDGAPTPLDATTDDTTSDGGTPLPDGSTLLPDGGTDPTGGCQTCDCDHDGYNRPGCGDNTGTDCDDLDSNVHPDAGFSTASPGKDLDCTHAVEKLYPVGVSCTGHLLDCASTAGFTTDAACGQQATYITCAAAVVVLGCNQASTATVTQACR